MSLASAGHNTNAKGRHPLWRKAGALSESSAGRGHYSLALALALCLLILFCSLPLPPTGAFQAEAGRRTEDPPCRCQPRPHGKTLAGLAHWYDDIGNTMANGEVFTGEGMTVAIRQDLIDEWPLGSKARLTSACDSVLVEVTDVMPYCESQPDVVLDVSPAVCQLLFCNGCGHNSVGVAYGEEFVEMEAMGDD